MEEGGEAGRESKEGRKRKKKKKEKNGAVFKRILRVRLQRPSVRGLPFLRTAEAAPWLSEGRDQGRPRDLAAAEMGWPAQPLLSPEGQRAPISGRSQI